MTTMIQIKYSYINSLYQILIDFNKLTIMWEFAHDNWKYVKGFIN
jgi:hypothetical protein